jgi:MYXO-CTERM domain-containing protein
VLSFEGFTPSYVMHATLLAPGPAPTAATLYSAPDCLSPVVHDAAGHRTALRAFCLGTEPILTRGPADAGSDPPGPGTDGPLPINDPGFSSDERPLCTVSSPGGGRAPRSVPEGVAGLAALMALALARRRP